MRTIFFFLALAIAGALSQTDCSTFENCAHCDHWYDYSVTGVSWASSMGSAVSEFSDSMKQALNIMKSFDEDGIKSNDIFDLHISIQYLCCYSTFTYPKIAAAMSKVEWAPIPLTLDKIICNYDPSNKTTSFVVLVSDEGQQALMELVESFESAIEEAGIPIHTHRSEQEPFHSTLAVVKDGYPSAEAIDAINAQIQLYNADPLIMDTFIWLTVPPFWFNATDGSAMDKQGNKQNVLFEIPATIK